MKHFLVALLGIFVAACGSDGETLNSTSVTSAKLIDSAVVGLSYVTSDGLSGTTGAGGSFECNAGSTITFKLNDYIFASGVPCSEFITPYSMASTADEQESIAVLLQNMDADGNSTNGITVDSTKEANVTADIDLADTGAVDTIAENAGSISRAAATTHLEIYGKNAGRYGGSFQILNNGSDGGDWCEPIPVSIGFDGTTFYPTIKGVTYAPHIGFGAAAYTLSGTARTLTATYSNQNVTAINGWTAKIATSFGGGGKFPLYFADPSPTADDISDCDAGEFVMAGVRLTDVVIDSGNVTGKFAAVVMCNVGGTVLTEYEWCNGSISITKQF